MSMESDGVAVNAGASDGKAAGIIDR